MDEEISHRKALTLVAMNKLWIPWHKNKISQNKKLRMFNAYIIHILLFNSLTKTGEAIDNILNYVFFSKK